MSSEILLAALSPVAAILTLLISQNYSRRIAKDDRADRAAQANSEREFLFRENRYVDRRDAVVKMLAAAADVADRVTAHEIDTSLAPGEIMDEDGQLSDLNSAYANLMVLAGDDVRRVAQELRDAGNGIFWGKMGSWERYNKAREELLLEARDMLAGGGT